MWKRNQDLTNTERARDSGKNTGNVTPTKEVSGFQHYSKYLLLNKTEQKTPTGLEQVKGK